MKAVFFKIVDKYYWSPNAAGEQRPVGFSNLHGFYANPRSSIRLLQWHGYVTHVKYKFSNYPEFL